MEITLISVCTNIFEPGLRRISSFLKQNNVKVNLIFLQVTEIQRISINVVKSIVNLSKNSALLGISLTSSYFNLVRDLTLKLKEYTNIPIIWGGVHPTTDPVGSSRYADIACIGEGELTLLDLLASLKQGKSYNRVAGICYKQNDEVVMNEKREWFPMLESLPFPDFDLATHFALDRGRLVPMKEEHFIKRYGNSYMILTSRGCPFSCAYCANNALRYSMKDGTNYHKKRSIEHVLKELSWAKSRFPHLEYVFIADDDFFERDLDEIIIFRSVYKKSTRLPFSCMATFSNMSKEKIEHLLDAGLNGVSIGIQSGSKRTLMLYKRPSALDIIMEKAQLLNQYGSKILIQYDVIVDNPWETEDDLISTLRLLIRLPRPFKLVVYSLTFYPGTELYEKSKRDKITIDYSKFYLDTKSTYWNSLFYLVSNLNLPVSISNSLISKKVVNHPLFAMPKFIIARSTNLFKGLIVGSRIFHSLKLGNISDAVYFLNMAKLKIYGSILPLRK